MATFTGRHSSTHMIRGTAAAATAAFADLDRQIACHPELASADKLDATSVQMRMREMKHGPVGFAGLYTLRFTTVGNTVRWVTERGNVNVRGEVSFSDTPSGVRMSIQEDVTVDIELPALVARALRPVVETMIGRGSGSFVERIVAELGRVG
jgi:hypothetical protein